MPLMEYAYLAQSVISGQSLMREQALAAPEADLSSLFDPACRARLHLHGKRAQVRMLSDAKSPLCLEYFANEMRVQGNHFPGGRESERGQRPLSGQVQSALGVEVKGTARVQACRA
jgi:hypothetical protein